MCLHTNKSCTFEERMKKKCYKRTLSPRQFNIHDGVHIESQNQQNAFNFSNFCSQNNNENENEKKEKTSHQIIMFVHESGKDCKKNIRKPNFVYTNTFFFLARFFHFQHR